MRVQTSTIGTTILVSLGQVTNRTLVLPLLIFFPTSRCNSRCVSCDWWRSSGAGDLTTEEVQALVRELPALGTRVVVFSGGEPLLRRNVFDLAAMFREAGMQLHLLTSGLLLERTASDVARHFARVTISLDAADAARYRVVRGVDAFDLVARGVARLREIAPQLPMTARATVHRCTFRDMPAIIECARAWHLDHLSFLPADVSSTAFGRGAADARQAGPAGLVLDPAEIDELEALIERVIADNGDLFASGFLEESPAKLRRLPRYFRALRGDAPFPLASCNAPSVSVVIEADGAVRPCFFHEPIGSVREQSLAAIVRRGLPAFRRTLDMAADPVCARCVCSMRTTWRRAPWQS